MELKQTWPPAAGELSAAPLGGALATQVGEFHPTSWWKFYPIGLGAAVVIAGIGHIIRCDIRCSMGLFLG